MSYNSKKNKKIETEILLDLIEKYENRWYKNSNFKNKVGIKLNIKEYKKYFDDMILYDEILKNLEKIDYIELTTKKYSDIIIQFNLNIKMVNDIYQYLNKTHPQVYFDRLIETFNKYSCEINDLKKEDFLRIYEEQKSIKSYLAEEYLELILVAYHISNHDKESYERNFSSFVFNDSKRLGTLKDQIFTYFSNENILIEAGIVQNPTYIFIKGEGKIIINNQTIDLKELDTVIGLPSTVIDSIVFEDVSKVYSIENLTTFNDFQTEGLIIYLGGFSNNHKIKLLSKLKDVTSIFYHFGDIDYGGFSILNHLMSKLDVVVKAHNMSISHLKLNKDKLIHIDDDGYLEKLRTLLDKKNLEPYYEVINYLIDNKVKLEQESIINN